MEIKEIRDRFEEAASIAVGIGDIEGIMFLFVQEQGCLVMGHHDAGDEIKLLAKTWESLSREILQRVAAEGALMAFCAIMDSMQFGPEPEDMEN